VLLLLLLCWATQQKYASKQASKQASKHARIILSFFAFIR
jgi:hypothetical protein